MCLLFQGGVFLRSEFSLVCGLLSLVLMRCYSTSVVLISNRVLNCPGELILHTVAAIRKTSTYGCDNTHPSSSPSSLQKLTETVTPKPNSWKPYPVLKVSPTNPILEMEKPEKKSCVT